MKQGEQEKEREKKNQVSKLNVFLQECLRAGCLRGFKYFALYLRGREELLCTVRHVRSTPVSTPVGHVDMHTNSSSSLFASMAGTSTPLALSQRHLMLSSGTQKQLSGLGSMNIGLPPASPCTREIAPDVHAEDHTVFLIAGYARYKCPYVWLRSNHHRLIKISGKDSPEKDNPLKLTSISDWAKKGKDIMLCDIFTELLTLSIVPPPRNPFALNFGYFKELPPLQRMLSTGAMIDYLSEVISLRHYSFLPDVVEEIKLLQDMHFSSLENDIPAAILRGDGFSDATSVGVGN